MRIVVTVYPPFETKPLIEGDMVRKLEQIKEMNNLCKSKTQKSRVLESSR